MHFIAKLFKIKYFPTFLSMWEKLSKYAFKFHKQFFCTVAIISCPFLTEYIGFNNMFFQLKNFRATECSYRNACLLGSVKAVSYTTPLKSQTV